MHLRGEGFPVDEFIPDGKIHRFPMEPTDKRKSGYYVGFRNFSPNTQEEFYVIAYGSWRDDKTKVHCSLSRKTSADESALIKKNMQKAQKVADETRVNAQKEVANDVQELWDKLSGDGVSEYLRRKQIVECRDLGVRFDDKGSLYIPVRDIEGKIWSLQKITWDAGKFFHPGGRVQGCFHQIGSVGRQRIFIAEGFATAASISLATGEGVVCAFNSGNLGKVAKEFKNKYPDSQIVICGDDDQWKEKNAGRTAAEDTAKKVLGVAIFPEFENTDTRPTDFNDLHCLEGLDKVSEQLLKSESENIPMAIYALGHKEKEYFFTSTKNRQIVSVSAFTEKDFLDLMTIDYWEAMFPGAANSRVNWTDARSTLMDQARHKGIFQAHHVRGAGVWMDEGRIVVNMGNHLIVDGEHIELGQLKSRYFYTLGKTLERLHAEPLTVEECGVLRDVCGQFKWTKSESGVLLAGGLVIARVCGALPIRPHIWITGGAQTGKTTLLERLVRPILGESKIYVQGNTTEAGVRQSLKADAVPILFDEFETNGPKSAENIAACIELLRAAWADSGAVIIKGGSSGNASHFQVRTSAIVSSIRTKLTTDADKGRFAVLELAPHGSDSDHWLHLSTLLSRIDSDFSERLFARTIKLLPTLLANYKLVRSALAKKVDSRFGDQYGMLLAGYSILLQDNPITIEEAEFMASNIDLIDEKEQAKIADHNDALEHLLTTKIQVETSSGSRKDVLIGNLIDEMQKKSIIDQNAKNALINIGIRVEDGRIVIVAANHAELEARVWRGTKWSQTWGISLARIKGASKNNLRINGAQKKCIIIPITTLT